MQIISKLTITIIACITLCNCSHNGNVQVVADKCILINNFTKSYFLAVDSFTCSSIDGIKIDYTFVSSKSKKIQVLPGRRKVGVSAWFGASGNEVAKGFLVANFKIGDVYRVNGERKGDFVDIWIESTTNSRRISSTETLNLFPISSSEAPVYRPIYPMQ